MTFSEFSASVEGNPTYVVLGVQGSGTNLVSRILKHVFDISIVRDRSLILATAASLKGSRSEADYHRAWDKIYRCLYPGPIRKRLLSRQWYHQASEYTGIEEYRATRSFGSPAEFANFFYTYHAFAAGCRDRGFKSDDCWEHLDSFDLVIPNRKVVLVVRDPRDNANSIMFKDFGPRTAFAASQFVNRQLELYLSEVDRRPHDAIVVNYETLLSSPLEFVDRFSSFSGLTKPADSQSRLDDLGIRVSNFDKWKKWPEKDIAISESIFAERIDRLGYTRHCDAPAPISAAAALGQRFADVCMRVPQRLKSTWDHKILAR